MKKILFSLILTLLMGSQVLLAQESKTKDAIYFDKGMKYYDAGNYKLAIVYFDSSIVINTENTEAYAFRGLAKFDLKQYNEAIEDFDLALILAPGYAEVYYYRALAKLEIGATDKACEDLYASYNYGFKKAMKIIENVCKEEEKK
jgi:tetratricopeptide (TPR) repeat protein